MTTRLWKMNLELEELAEIVRIFEDVAHVDRRIISKVLGIDARMLAWLGKFARRRERGEIILTKTDKYRQHKRPL